MRVSKHLFAALAIFPCMVVFNPGAKSQESMYDSIDILSEILTISQTQSVVEFNSKKVIEGAIDGLLDQLDPHSNYYDAARYQTMREDQEGKFFGIGIIVGYQNDRLTVVSPLDGGPAGRAGIRAGDAIVKIDGVSTEQIDSFEAIRLLRGDENTPVTVSVKRPGLEALLDFDLLRAEIPSKNVRASFKLDERTGYVALKDFGEFATEEVHDAVAQLERKGIGQLILDLRGNPGGLLPQAIGVASLFVPGEKLVVSTKGRLRNANQEYFSRKKSSLKLLPLIVLIDRGSASASEIVAGAIQDHDRGLILGVSSWGKGLVQSVFPLSGGEKGLALTTARYYTPSGRNIQGDYKSLDDYYNPESSESVYFSNTSPKNAFKTVHGRDVLEVRGITPDVYIAFPKQAELVQKLDSEHSAFFNFATRYAQRYHPESFDWELPESAFGDFEAYLRKEGIKSQGLEDHQALVRERITYQAFNIHNQEWSWQYLMSVDNQVRAALALFPKANELLKVYSGEAELSSDYTSTLRQFAKLNQPSK